MGMQSFNDFTVEQFQEWHKVISQEDDILERELKLAAILTGKSVEYLESIPRNDLTRIFVKVNRIGNSIPSTKVNRYVMVGRSVYSAILDAKELHGLMSTSQFTAAKTYAANPIENMHMLLPLYYTKFKLFGKKNLEENQLKLSEEFKKVKIGDVYGAVFFYSVLWNQFAPILEASLKEATTIIEGLVEDGQDFIKHTDGMPPLNG